MKYLLMYISIIILSTIVVIAFLLANICTYIWHFKPSYQINKEVKQLYKGLFNKL